MQSVHVDDPAKIINIGGIEPVKFTALINFIALNRRFARGLDFNPHLVLRKLLVRRYIPVDDDVTPALILINRSLNFDGQQMFIVADGGDFTLFAGRY